MNIAVRVPNSLVTYDYLEDRGKQGNIKHLQSILDIVPEVKPDNEDKL